MWFFLLVAFGVGPGAKCGHQWPPEYERIFDLPSPELQRTEFKKLPPASQVDMYCYAMSTEPPSQSYVDYLASSGQAVIPDLIVRLEHEDSNYNRVAFIRVFRQIHRKYYDLRDSPEIVEKLKRESAKITDSAYRHESEEYIEAITSPPKTYLLRALKQYRGVARSRTPDGPRVQTAIHTLPD